MAKTAQLDQMDLQTLEVVLAVVATEADLTGVAAQVVLVSLSFAGKTHHQMRILQCSLHLDHGSRLLVQHRLSI